VSYPAKRPEKRDDAALRPGVLPGQERERERERCVSAADASTYGPIRARVDPWHVCPQLTHANTTIPHHATRSLSPNNPYKRLNRSETNPNPIYFLGALHIENTRPTNHKHTQHRKSTPLLLQVDVSSEWWLCEAESRAQTNPLPPRAAPRDSSRLGRQLLTRVHRGRDHDNFEQVLEPDEVVRVADFSGTRRGVLIYMAIYVGSKLVVVDMPHTGERGEDLGLRHEPPAAYRPQLAHGVAVASHDERFAPIELTHDLAALVAQLPLGDLTHTHSVARVRQAFGLAWSGR
jgi:hypothetical protein